MAFIKFVHIVAIVSWFAGLLYLPRLFVYHADCQDSVGKQRFTLMEGRLYWRIMTPAAGVALLSGLALMGLGFGGGWLLIKLILVFLLIVFHFSCAFYIRRFRQEENTQSSRFFRFYNEIPTLLLVGIVYLVVVKPF